MDGALNADLATFLCGANLVALPKGNGKVRPIAIGETLRRLVARILAYKGA